MSKDVTTTAPAAPAVEAGSVTLTIEKSRNEQHLVFTRTKFMDGLQVSQKRGILQVDTENYDIDEILEKARTAEWILKGPADQSGFYKPERKGAESED
jgi:hypothetical protein